MPAAASEALHLVLLDSSFINHHDDGIADGGIGMSDHAKCQVDELLDQLKAIGKQQQPRPLSNPLLWGNYNVAYTSTGRAQSERGQRKQLAILLSMTADKTW